jgi:hypothetical protein
MEIAQGNCFVQLIHSNLKKKNFMPGQNSLRLSTYILKNEGQQGKTGTFRGG